MQTITELKAKAYDLIAEIDHYNNSIAKVRELLSKVNQEIQAKYNEGQIKEDEKTD